MIVTSKSVTAKHRPSIHKESSDFSTVIPAQIVSFQARRPVTKFNEQNRLKERSLKQRIVNLFPAGVQDLFPDIDVRISVLCITWYLSSSVSSNLSKAILSEFPHPVGLTELQFLISAALCLTFVSFVNILHRPEYALTTSKKIVLSLPEGIIPSYLDGCFNRSIRNKFLIPTRLIWSTTFPMGIFQFMGHIATHQSTTLIPVSLVHLVKALSPIATVCFYRFVKGKQYNAMTYYTLIPLILGVMITCYFSRGSSVTVGGSDNTSFLIGLTFAFISMLIFVSQNIFAKNILTVKSKEMLPRKNKSQINLCQWNNSEHSPQQLDKVTILFYCSCIGFILTFPIFVSNEIFNNSESVFAQLNLKVFSLVVIHGVSHFFQAMLAFHLIGMLSSVGYSIANIMKRIVIIGVALIWESNLSINQLFGLVLTVCGLYGYDKWGNKK